LDAENVSRTEDVEEKLWPHADLRCGREADPLIPPGEYDAYAKAADIVIMRFGRQSAERLVIVFEIRGGPRDGAHLRFIVPLPPRKRGVFGKSPAPSSKFFRAWVVANCGRRPDRSDRMSLEVFRHKLFRIRVRTVQNDRNQERLPECNQYSVVDALLERIA